MTSIERILVVDDEPSIRELLRRICLHEGYDAVTAASGQEALAALRQGPLALALVDLRLPDMDGIEVLRAARGLDANLLVIILTGYADLKSAVEAMHLGAYDYIAKDALNMQLIPLIIQRALDRRRLNLRNRQLIADLQRANAELQQRRALQLRSLQQTGQALAGRLDFRGTAQVMLQAALDTAPCDAAALLVVAPDIPRQPLALLGGHRELGPTARQALLDLLLQHAPPELRVERETVDVHDLSAGHGQLDDAPWERAVAAPLHTAERPLGVMLLASHGEAPCDQEARDILHILATQGSIALENGFLFARMRELATRDSLTGLHNRSHFFEALEAELSRAERHRRPFAVIMVDLDRPSGLKEINDTYGHQMGDAVLREVAHRLAANVRASDLVARYGGDEFSVLAPETGQEQAMVLAHRLRQRLSDTPILLHGLSFSVTASLGVAVFEPGSGLGVSALIDLADRSLYMAKEEGGNRVFVVQWD